MSLTTANRIPQANACSRAKLSRNARSSISRESQYCGCWPPELSRERVRLTDAALERKGRESRKRNPVLLCVLATSAFDRVLYRDPPLDVYAFACCPT